MVLCKWRRTPHGAARGPSTEGSVAVLCKQDRVQSSQDVVGHRAGISKEEKGCANAQEKMYQLLMRINRYVSVGASAVLLLSFVIPSVQAALGLNTVAGLVIYSAILAGSVLADKRLARLSFNEVCQELKDVDLEEATKKFWEEDKQRKREEANRR
ncbi:hypothetical protein Rfer_4411 (plasmid) [Rhodoferax ferrireducens T118]|uniref:Uncharacterized protein n=2 Tax=Rhodoferax ferrireducens TaxID=192843 RepID=Q21Q48_ALBFT|nr:hypothetical protein Rfer_4411 [Rhodoferax ferrireducens T118]